MLAVMPGRAALVAAVSCAALAAAAASGQPIAWQNAAGGAWSVATNWNPNTVPISTSHAALIGIAGTYTVLVDLSPSLASLDVANPGATLAVQGGRVLGSAAWSNNGTIVVNSNAAASDTVLRINATATLSGTGTVVLNAVADSHLSRAYITRTGSAVLTNGAEHTIRGTGQISGTPLTNEGLVQADLNTRVLQVYNAAASNSGTLRASDGGILSLSLVPLSQSAGGQVVADSGTFRLDGNSSVTGGALSAVNAGVIQNAAGTTNTLASVTLAGPVHVREASLLALTGTVTNNGAVTVNPAGLAQDTTVRIDSNVTLAGNGSLALNAVADSALTRAQVTRNGAFTLTNGAGHTIRGAGVLSGVPTINEGLVQADVDGRVLRLFNATADNAGTIRASAGGILSLSFVPLSQSSGAQVVADGGTFRLDGSSSVTGGTLSAVNAGVIQNASGTTNTLSNVTLSGPTHVREASLLALTGTITNSGAVTVNPAGTAQDTTVRIDSNVTLAGDGSLVLNAVADSALSRAQVTRSGAFTLTNGAAHAIRGTGRLNGVPVVNQGLVHADADGRVLQFYNAAADNAGTIRASAGGILSLSLVPLSQSAGGQVVADGGTFRLDGSSSVTGGALSAMNAGGIQNAPGTSNTLANVTLAGPVHVREASLLALTGTITNNGAVTVNPAGMAQDTTLRIDSNVTLAGNGSLSLNAVAGGALTRAQVTRNGAFTLTNGAGHTIRGRGVFNGCPLVNHGTLSPGAAPTETAVLQVYSATFAQGAGGVFDVEVASATAFDQLSCPLTSATLGGALRVRLVGGYKPPLGSFFDVVSAPSGSVSGVFATHDLPPIRAQGRSFAVQYLPTAVRVRISCPADYDADGVVAPADVALLVNRWYASLADGTLEADYDDDGAVLPGDVALFVNTWLASLTGPC
jgi:hypothetical protein